MKVLNENKAFEWRKERNIGSVESPYQYNKDGNWEEAYATGSDGLYMFHMKVGLVSELNGLKYFELFILQRLHRISLHSFPQYRNDSAQQNRHQNHNR